MGRGREGSGSAAEWWEGGAGSWNRRGGEGSKVRGRVWKWGGGKGAEGVGRGAGREQKLCDVTGRVDRNGRPGGNECIAIVRGAARE